MNVRRRLFVAVPLLFASAALTLFALGSASSAGIENPRCELIRPGIYRIDFQASPDAGAVEVFASSRPDRIDSDKPLTTIRKTPAEVPVTGRSGRVYFYLKPKSGVAQRPRAATRAPPGKNGEGAASRAGPPRLRSLSE